MQCYAVVDTNVIVSALIAKKTDSPPRQVFRAMLSGDIIPLYHSDILSEYEEVLSRKKFHLNSETIQTVLLCLVATIRGFVRSGRSSQRFALWTGALHPMRI